MRNRVGGMYLNDNKILLVHRIRELDGNIREYYVIPGGGVENNESLSDALIREMKEEIGVDIVKYSNEPKYVYKTDKESHYYYLIEKFNGKIGTGVGPEFNDESYKDHGQYLIEMVDLADIISNKIELVPKDIKDQIIKDISN